ncbi:MAG TPA: SHOCT domain-containing protein, partial [Jatrophihabitantaceae bacterium]
VQDPVMRAQVEKMAASFGVTMPTTAPPPVAGPTATPTAPASAPARDVTGELGRLQKLHAAGVLTDAEYETQRTRVLNEI